MEEEIQNKNENQSYIKCLQEIKTGVERLWTVCWHPSGEFFATGGTDKAIRIWGKQNKDDKNYIQLQLIDDVHDKSIRSLKFSPDGKMLASGSFDAQIGVYKLDEQTKQYEHITKLEGHDNEVKSVDWSSDSKFLISCSRDKTVWVWDFDEDLDFSCYAVLDGHSQDVKMVKFVPDSFDIVSCSFDDTIRYWEQDDEDWETKATFTEHSSIVWAMDFTDNGNVMASVGEDEIIKIWAKNQDSFSKFPYNVDYEFKDMHQRPIYSCSFNKDGTFLATAGGDNCLTILQKELEGEQRYQLLQQKEEAHVQDINCVAFSPKDEDIMISVGDDFKIKIWEIIPNF